MRIRTDAEIKAYASGDAISRQAAIEATWFEPSYTDPLNVLTEVRDRLKALPSEQQWIPCSERLPSDDEDVIVSVLEDHGDRPWKYTTVAWLCNGVWISDNEILFGTAVAWMPLPKPYREGRR